MRRLIYIFSYIFILIGVITIILTSILNEIMPKIARLVYISSNMGGFDPVWYKMNFGLVNTISVVLIILGSVVLLRLFIKYEQTRKFKVL